MDLNDYTPDTPTAVKMLALLGCGNDPVEIPCGDGWLEMQNGLYEFAGGSLYRLDTPHEDCPTCTCDQTIDVGGSSADFKLRYYAMDVGMVEGTLFEMILDRMGIELIK